MARTQHSRTDDHFGPELDSIVELDGATISYADGDVLHDVLSDLDFRVGALADQIGDPTSVGTVNFILDGSTGIKGDVELGFRGSWTAARLFADQAGSMVVDIWKDTYANYPPVVGDSITASAKPTISATDKSQDTTLTGWTALFSAGDVLRINVDSVSTITRATLSLTFRRAESTGRLLSAQLTFSDTAVRAVATARTLTDAVTITDAAYVNLHTAADTVTISTALTAVVT